LDTTQARIFACAQRFKFARRPQAHTVTSNPIKTEPTLLERIGAGDKAAVALLLDKYGPLVWSIARRQAGIEAAEDLVQEIFIQIWSQAERYDPKRASEATFITTVARRRVIDHSRKLGRRPVQEELPEQMPTEVSPLEAVDIQDEARVAAEAIAELKPDQQQVLRLSIVEGMTHPEIAELTKLPLGTVKSHARRGLERVRTILNERREAGGDSV